MNAKELIEKWKIWKQDDTHIGIDGGLAKKLKLNEQDKKELTENKEEILRILSEQENEKKAQAKREREEQEVLEASRGLKRGLIFWENGDGYVYKYSIVTVYPASEEEKKQSGYLKKNVMNLSRYNLKEKIFKSEDIERKDIEGCEPFYFNGCSGYIVTEKIEKRIEERRRKRIEEKERKENEKLQQEKEKLQVIFQKAKETGVAQIISTVWIEAKDGEIIEYKLANPNGSISYSRQKEN